MNPKRKQHAIRKLHLGLNVGSVVQPRRRTRRAGKAMETATFTTPPSEPPGNPNGTGSNSHP